MRKIQKQEILEFVKSLYEAHKEINAALEKGAKEAAQSMLCECQEYAIELGNVIERFEGEGFITVSYLEKYCEILYHYYEKLSEVEDIKLTQNKKMAKKIIAALNKQLLSIENSIKNDIKEKKEIVFFPYKASMWDSLESVYLAAREDENCDAYCVPIPYFDKNPDGSLGQMHYEGREYPKNIEVIDWRSYNFKERRPDVIYIHNPYDEFNHVTCVHQDYFAKNLKKYTEKLVYIPYFVLAEIEPDNQSRIDGMKHFCFLPGTIYADKVILQSESMRQIYINEYRKAAALQNVFYDRKELEEKFLGTGSPKFDKVRNSKFEDVEIPKEWLKIIQKPDGTWKKIIFYNTSIAALLQSKEEMLEKIKYVLHTFEEEQEKVALLWRPHPLIESTIKSMHPYLWSEYSEIVEQYKAEGWGIYDDTADLNRAVVISDAYYGDMSSVVQVYQETGKPIMVQNANVTDENKYSKSLLLSRGVEFDKGNNTMWILTNFSSTLVKIDLYSKKIVGIFQIPLEKYEDYEFVELKKINEYIYMLPHNARDMYCFSIVEEKFLKLKLPLYEYEWEICKKFKQMLYKNNFLYLIGHGIKAILRVDILKKTITRIVDYSNCKQILAYDAIFIQNSLYIPLAETAKILKLDSRNNTLEEILLEGEEGFLTITNLNNNLLLTDMNNNRLVYDLKESRIVEKECLKEVHIKNEKVDMYNNYQKVIINQDNEYYFMYFDTSIMKKKKQDIGFVPYKYPKYYWNRDEYSKYELIKKYKQSIYFQARSTGEIFMYNLDKEDVTILDIQVSKQDKEILNKNLWKNKQKSPIMENNVYFLKSYLKYTIKI